MVLCNVSIGIMLYMITHLSQLLEPIIKGYHKIKVLLVITPGDTSAPDAIDLDVSVSATHRGVLAPSCHA